MATFGLCPRCGCRSLFGGVIRFAARCHRCRLDYGAFNVGDGAAPFLIFLVGGVLVGLAMWVELDYAPSIWVHVALWPAIGLALTLILLRFAKGLLVAMEYRHRRPAGTS